MRIAPPHAGHRRRSGRKTRSRSGVLDWHLAIAPLQLDCKPNRPSLPDSKLCRRRKKLDEVVAEEAARRPDLPVEVFATDEHRLGLKPVLRRVWAPKGERPIALGHHRYKWLYVTAFTQPLSGETIWYLATGVSKAFFAPLLARFPPDRAAAPRPRIPLP